MRPIEDRAGLSKAFAGSNPAPGNSPHRARAIRVLPPAAGRDGSETLHEFLEPIERTLDLVVGGRVRSAEVALARQPERRPGHNGHARLRDRALAKRVG